MASPFQPPPEIVCPDCGGPAYLNSYPPHEGWEPGQLVAYRCRDCLDRWDLVVEELDEDPTPD